MSVLFNLLALRPTYFRCFSAATHYSQGDKLRQQLVIEYCSGFFNHLAMSVRCAEVDLSSFYKFAKTYPKPLRAESLCNWRNQKEDFCISILWFFVSYKSLNFQFNFPVGSINYFGIQFSIQN